MKYISAALIALFLSANAHPIAETGLESRAADTCGYPTVPLLQAYATKLTTHFYTTNATYLQHEILHDESAGFESQGDAAQVFSSQVPLTVPFYELYSSKEESYFYTTSTKDVQNAINAGYTEIGIACYVYPSNDCSSVPLYKAHNPQLGDYFLTTNLTARDDFIDNKGYVDEGIAAYVIPPL